MLTGGIEPDDRRAVLKHALRALDELQSRLAAAESARRSPIAVVGIGCRYPGGASTPESYWRLLCDRVDAVTDVPADRWDVNAWYDADRAVPGRTATRWGAFLPKIDQFDAQFFGIASREAAMLDPQQRLLLEVGWEALENAGIAPDHLGGSRTGVFVGITNTEYFQLLMRTVRAHELDAYMGTGNALNAAAGRLSYFLGLQGPCMAVDTACSSSLVAVHLACQSLRNGECDLALAAGVNVILVPEMFVLFSKWGMTAADGRCKAFAAAADGFVRGEGCGVVVLKRLSDALNAGDSILAVIKGSAVNQDGRSSGLTVPNGLAQQQVIRQAMEDAGVTPAEVDYVEAHGTGTTVGDPIEVEALAAVLGAGRSPDRPLRIGSVKTNLGHTESAAGVAGLIKTVLAIHHEELPPQLHLDQLTPGIPWDAIAVDVVTERTPWPRGEIPRVAGVSSFGLSGTNAHVIVTEPPVPVQPRVGIERPLHVIALSAKTPDALRDLAGSYASHLADARDESLASFCFSANTGRTHFPHRVALAAPTADALRAGLEAVADGNPPAAAATGKVDTRSRSKIAFLFTGQGSQYAGMGRRLYETQPTFRRTLDRCAELVRPHIDRPLLAILFSDDGPESALDRTAYAQPALFALEYALAELWRTWGVEPDALLGHSVGEYVAACQAGVITLEHALRLIAARGRLMQALPAGGTMAAVFADEDRVRRATEAHSRDVVVAAVNAPNEMVISGPSEEVRRLLNKFEADGIRTSPLAVSHAFHSPQIEPMLAAFAREASGIAFAPPHRPLISNVTGSFANGAEIATADYWVRHARQPVRFAAGVEALHHHGCNVFLEIGPSSTLLGLGRRCLGAGIGTWLPSLLRGRDEWETILGTLTQLYVRGAEIDWTGFDRDYDRRRVRVPNYPFQRRRFWIAPSGNAKATESFAHRAPTTGGHPILDHCTRSPLIDAVLWSGRVGVPIQPWLQDHLVFGSVVMPMTAYVEMALAAAGEQFGAGPHTIEELIIQEPLILDSDAVRGVQLVLTPGAEENVPFRIISLDPSAEGTSTSYVLHATGRIRRGRAELDGGSGEEMTPEAIDRIRSASGAYVEADELYRSYAERGIAFGDSFRGVQHVWVGDRETIADVVLPEVLLADAGKYAFHPAFLDACLHPMAAACSCDDPVPHTYLPLSVERFSLHARPAGHVISHTRFRSTAGESRDTLVCDVRLFTTSGELLAELNGLLARRADRAAIEGAARGRHTVDDSLYEVVWRPQPIGVQTATAFGTDAPELNRVTDGLDERLSAYAQHANAVQYGELLPNLETLATDYALRALRQLGWSPRAGDRLTREGLASQLRIAARSRRLFGRILEMLEEDGLLVKTLDGWEIRRAPDPADPSIMLQEFLAAYPSLIVELGLVGRCCEALADVLRATRDPLQLLFAPGGQLEALYRESPVSQAWNLLVRDVFAALLAALPADRKLRILEVGAGTGGTTSYVLPLLPADRVDYMFTDVSPLFTARAAETFGKYAFLEPRILDIERDPTTQGFAAHEFDVILAANVLHATADVRRSLDHIRRMLAPDGVLILQETTRPQRWIDLTFGLTDGWWKFTDTILRPHHPLLAPRVWLDLLGDLAYQDARAIYPPEADSPLAGNAVIVARAIRDARVATESRPKRWIILADRGGVGSRIAAALESHGHTCLLAEQGPSTDDVDHAASLQGCDPGEECRRLLHRAASAGDRAPVGILHMRSLDTPSSEDLTIDELWRAQEEGCRSALSVAQALATGGGPVTHRLWLITRGAKAVGESVTPLAVAQSALSGLGKIIAREHPELNATCIDLDPYAGDIDLAAVIATLLDFGDEDQLAFRNGMRYVARLVPCRPNAVEAPVRLESSTPGVLDGLAWQPTDRHPPGPEEVQIRVEASALNFRDVLGALDMYPGGCSALGGEVSGVVSAIGSDVSGFSIGDAVAGLAAGGFASYATTQAGFVVHKPTRLSFAEAATIPSAFLTAYYALHHVGKLARGERVLIHAAAGGVGLGAVQLAKRAGCEIFATAGSAQKREFLASLGVRHVFDSRSLDFAEEVLRATRGEGVDVVLNSLSGEFIPASLNALQPRGRFLEIGRRDVWDAARVAAVRPDAAYTIIDLAALSQTEPSLVRDVLAEVMAILHDGEIGPLPYRVFSHANVAAAFRHMAQAKHIGKLVVASSNGDRPAGVAAPFAARNDKTYLVTGGLAGLGLLTAKWLVQKGARHLALMARREPSPKARQSIGEMEERGVRVLLCRGDVARGDDVVRALADITETMPSLRGVFHSAGVLDDGLILQQNWERFAGVLAPKVAGAWHLHRLTENLALDCFVLYSSASALLGSPGQSNHAAANAFLDALAHHRRALGLPALSVNWGAWSETGAAVRNRVGTQITKRGVRSINPHEGFDALEHLLAASAVQAAVLPVDWRQFLTQIPRGGQRLFLNELIVSPVETPALTKAQSAPDLPARLSAARPADRRKLLLAYVRDHVATVLGLDDPGTIDANDGLSDLGIDSLMSLELRNRLQAGVGCSLPSTLVFDYPTVAGLARFLGNDILKLDESGNDGCVAALKPTGLSVEEIAAIGRLSPDEAEALLLEELAQSTVRRS